MLTDYWAHHYDDLRREGREEDEEFEDEDFDLEKIKAEMEADPDGWEAVIDDRGAD